jgi:hypothetical protein
MKEEEHARNALTINFRDAAWLPVLTLTAGNAVIPLSLYKMNK